MAYVIPEKKAIVLSVRPGNEYKVTSVFPVFKQFIQDTKCHIAVPLALQSIKLLRNIGVDMDGVHVLPHRYDYPLISGKYAPMPAQVETSAFLSEHHRAFCLSTPRAGKTAASIGAADFLQQMGEVRSVLVIAPLVTIPRVWNDEIIHMTGKTVVQVHGASTKEREALLRTPADFYLINPDGIKLVAPQLFKMIKSKQIELIIVDECTEFGEVKSQRWKALNQLINKAHVKYCWGLTGTPGGAEKVYAQAKLIHPDNVPRYITDWRHKTQFQIGPAWKDRTGIEQVLYDALSPAIRFDKRDMFDIPPVEHVDVVVEMDEQQAKIYHDLRVEMVTQIGDQVIKSDLASAMVSKLLQVSSGVLNSEEGLIHISMQNKLSALREIIEGTTRKVVIFASFTGVINRLVDEIRGFGFTCEKIDGAVSKSQRMRVFANFMDAPDPRVVVCHPRTTAFGVELARADTIVMFGAPMAGDIMYAQAIERLSSAKQEAEVTRVIHLSSSKADTNMFSKIAVGVAGQQTLLDKFKQIIETD